MRSGCRLHHDDRPIGLHEVGQYGPPPPPVATHDLVARHLVDHARPPDTPQELMQLTFYHPSADLGRDKQQRAQPGKQQERREDLAPA